MRRHTHQGAAGGLMAARAGFGCAGPVVGGVLILGLAWLLLTTLVSTFDPIERDRRQAELYDRSAMQDETYGARLFAAKIWAAAPALAGLVLLSGGSVVLLLAAHRRLTAWESIRAHHAIEHTRAATKMFPEGLESLSFHDSHRVEAAPQLPPLLAEPVEAEPDEPPTFAAMLDAGRIGRGQPLCLGIDAATGEGVWGSWRDLFSTGIGGKQGSGKGWTAAGLIAQSMLNGARVILCDPHDGDAESLTARLAPLLPFCELVATDNAAILEAAKYAADELARRREKRTSSRAPYLLVIDEWTSLLRRDPKLAQALTVILPDLTQEGRKYEVNAMLLAQRWEGEAAGGTDVRNTLTAHYVHHCRSDEGRMQTGMRAASWPGDPLTLKTGQAFLFTAKGDVRKVYTPLMTEADLARVAVLLGASPGPQIGAEPRSIGFHVPAPADPAARARPGRGPDSGPDRASASESAKPGLDLADPEIARILAKIGAGASVHDVAAELSGTTNPSDRRYKAARTKVEAIFQALAVKIKGA